MGRRRIIRAAAAGFLLGSTAVGTGGFGPPARAGSAAVPSRSFRMIAFDYKQRIADTETYDTYHAGLRKQIAAAKKRFSGGTPTLAFLPEDTGLLAWFVGPRGEAGRQAAEQFQNETAAVAALAPAYQLQIDYYESKCPGIPPPRALLLALTDTAWRAFGEALAAFARRYGIWIMANLNAPDITVTRDPAKVAALADPEQASRGYAYEGGCEVWNTAFLFRPHGTLDADGAADPAKVVFGEQKKMYLVPVERDQSAGLAMNSESPAGARVIDAPFAQLGVLTSKDAWMSDVVERLGVEGMQVFLQPEAGAWAGHDEAGLPNWPPDNMTRAMWSMVQWQPETAWGALADLTGNFGSLYFDGTATVVRDTRAGERPRRFLLGRRRQLGVVARAPWVFGDPPKGVRFANLRMRRKRLDALGQKLTPGSGDALENGQLANYVAVDVTLPVDHPKLRRVGGASSSVAVATTQTDQWAPQIIGAPDASSLDVTWTDLRDGFESPYIAVSTDGGGSWSTAVKAGDSTARESDQQDNQYDAKVGMSPDGSLHLVWADFRNQSWDVYGSRSEDGGTTWADPVRVDHSPSSSEGFPNENLDQDPVVAVLPDGRLLAAWSDARGRRVDRGIRVARSLDGGRTWFGDIRADGSGERDADQWAPTLAPGRGGHVVLAWQDQRTGWNQIFTALSTDGGRTFSRPVRIAPSRADQWNPAAGIAGGKVVIAFSQGRGAGGRRIRIAYSSVRRLARGRTADSVRNADPAYPVGVRQDRPAVSFDGGLLLVVWQDDRGGDWDVLARQIGGPGYTQPPVRIDDGPPGSDAWLPSIASPGPPIVAWEDARSGVSQIRVAPIPVVAPGLAG